jgi:branched-chain amino acid transport system ATP-binding protein
VVLVLRVDQLTAGYGQATVLRDITFDVPTGGLCTVVGPNGAGKTTLVNTLAGLLRAQGGAVYHQGVALHRLSAHLVARVGVALVPQGRHVFPSLSVAEHLAIAGRRQRGPWTTDRILATLPTLRPLLHRPGRYLSGGEQQMLAIARALATNPSLLLLDEPTEGLAPTLAQTVTDLIATIAGHGVTVLTTATTPPARHHLAQQTVVRLHAGRATLHP